MKWICSYLLLSSLCLSQAYAAAPEIKLCYEDVSVFPWITGDDKGLVITELHIVEKMLNLRFKLIRLPWKRCQIEAQAGNLDGLIAATQPMTTILSKESIDSIPILFLFLSERIAILNGKITILKI
jgi:hypothetical protein